MTIWWPVRTSHECARADHMHNHGNVEFHTYYVSKPQGSHSVNNTDMSHQSGTLLNCKEGTVLYLQVCAVCACVCVCMSVPECVSKSMCVCVCARMCV